MEKPKKKPSVLLVLLLFSVIIVSFKNAFTDSFGSRSTISPLPAPKTEAQIKAQERQAKLEAKFGKKPTQNGFDSSYRVVKSYLESVAKDPDSIKIETCTPVSIDEKNGWLVGCDYRGKNSFGGMTRNSNWFLIKKEKVQKMLPATAYKF